MRIRTKRRGKNAVIGKKIVYITPYRNAAIETMKEYHRKGYEAGVEREVENGQNLYIVFIYSRD
ncbi:MAG: hypothetical protein N3F07_04200 [Candidatus Micrarchaeota archaeon]|nr:hypothetical protein [Candidatus Micrarchaeota archaeon]